MCMRVRGVVPVLLAAALGAGLSVPPAAAQSNQPVYPIYDGFHVTAEGVYVISYAYFSHNFDVVTLPPGPANAFGTEPADRRQPRTFRPGHHRFQCVMVMGRDFTGGLRWTLGHAGTTTSTSEDMLQYNWELDDRTVGAVLREVDVESAPRGVCLNRSPLVRFLGLRAGPDGEPPEVAAAVGAELKLFGSVRDEGLPRGGELTSTWRVLEGPGGVRFSAPDEPRTLAWFDAPGVYELELRASDSERETAARLVVRVGADE
ncbi:MAG: hypothetical protein OXF93_10310 [Acidobacteria bacterium]|nr:hypothetical protein [Acidobacteriota bacterium]